MVALALVPLPGTFAANGGGDNNNKTKDFRPRSNPMGVFAYMYRYM